MKRRITQIATIALLTFTAPSNLLAEMPSGPISLIVGFGEGGGVDTLAREVARGLERRLGNNVIVENLAGGGGTVAADALSGRSADSTSIAMTLSMAVSFVPQASDTDFSADDFTYLGAVSELGTLLSGRTDRGYYDFGGLMSYATTQGYVIYGSATPLDRMIMQSIGAIEGFEVDVLPARGGSALRAALIAGDADAVLSGASGYNDMVETENVAPFATMNTRRLPNAPDLPTLQELGYEFALSESMIIYAQAGMDAEVVDLLSAAIVETAREPEIQALITRMGSVPIALDGPATRSLIDEQIEAYGALIANGG